MKKIIAMMLCLMMLAVTAMCFAEATEPECVEIWENIAVFRDDVQMEEGTYPYIVICLYDDGTVCAEIGTRAQEGTFEMTTDPEGYILTFGDASAFLTYDAGTGCLYLEDAASGQTAVFMLRTDMPGELYAGSIDDFQGTWHVTSMINGGSLIHMDSAAAQEVLNNANAADAAVVIEGSKVTFFGILEGEGELADGILFVTAPYSDMIITLTEGDSIIVDIIAEKPTLSKIFAGRE